MVSYWTPELGRHQQPEGVPFASWQGAHGTARFARHPAGFDVFLPASALDSSDEYAGGDPYGVDKELSSPFHRTRIDTAARLLEASLNGKQRPAVLDLGCGGGHLLARIAGRLPDAELVGLDYSLSAIVEARRTVEQAQLVVADALNAPFPDASFDVVLCTNLWEHVDCPIALARAARRILKPGGEIIISTPSRYRFQNLLRVVRGRHVGFMSKMHVTEYTVGQVIEMLHFAGFEIVEIEAPNITRHFARWPRRFVVSVFGQVLRRVGSHHVLEPTIFVRARPA